MTEEKRASTQTEDAPLSQPPGHAPADDNAGGDEPVPGGLQNSGGEND